AEVTAAEPDERALGTRQQTLALAADKPLADAQPVRPTVRWLGMEQFGIPVRSIHSGRRFEVHSRNFRQSRSGTSIFDRAPRARVHLGVPEDRPARFWNHRVPIRT